MPGDELAPDTPEEPTPDTPNLEPTYPRIAFPLAAIPWGLQGLPAAFKPKKEN